MGPVWFCTQALHSSPRFPCHSLDNHLVHRQRYGADRAHQGFVVLFSSQRAKSLADKPSASPVAVPEWAWCFFISTDYIRNDEYVHHWSCRWAEWNGKYRDDIRRFIKVLYRRIRGGLESRIIYCNMHIKGFY